MLIAESGTPFSVAEEERIAAIVAERLAPIDAKLDQIIAALGAPRGED
ncbi:hypothetical protein SAMN06295912_13513 [Sphingomonas laterariae]|uniref:Uncharacterized protein n=1 Tax=Edaphosphingomonas laterariae TaxID=861865 RepID=A0A239JI19_9SPHN|nr:hypothetical protein [Sphingomonas laterariae]SNT05477.1 hypothetical protein SAMN06295912_13513 [Sphingomonas laterariae]